jgi:hypothetical protein
MNLATRPQTLLLHPVQSQSIPYSPFFTESIRVALQHYNPVCHIVCNIFASKYNYVLSISVFMSSCPILLQIIWSEIYLAIPYLKFLSLKGVKIFGGYNQKSDFFPYVLKNMIVTNSVAFSPQAIVISFI